MDEATAWVRQGQADAAAVEALASASRCHALAKCQQAVEKTVKGVVAALRDAGVISAGPRKDHGVTRYMRTLTRLPPGEGRRTIQLYLIGLFDEPTRAAVEALDGLAPRLPPRRNTEYPFPAPAGGWTYPAADGVFSASEVVRFRTLVRRVVGGAVHLVPAINRMPR